jgi:FG-GAP repeat
MPMRRTVHFLALFLLLALAVPTGAALAQPAGSAAAAAAAASAGADFNDDGVTDLAVGAPAEDVSGAFNAGAVSALYGAAGGLSTAGGQLFTQNSPGVPGGAEDFDSFGGNFFNAG